MPTRPRRLLAIVALPLPLLLTACGSTAPTPSLSPASDQPSPSGSAATAVPSAAAGQTETDWGRIWDAVPASFPRFPGSTPADDAGGDAVSARHAVAGGDPQAIATWFGDALPQGGFSTVGLNGPGEDGGFTIDSTGDGDCRVQTTVAPVGDMTFISVRYGAGCPAP